MVMIQLGTESQMTEIFVLPSNQLLSVFKILSQVKSLFRDALYGAVILVVTVSGLRIVPSCVAVGNFTETCWNHRISISMYLFHGLFFQTWLHFRYLQDCLTPLNTARSFHHGSWTLFPRWMKAAADVSHLRSCCMYQAWGRRKTF